MPLTPGEPPRPSPAPRAPAERAAEPRGNAILDVVRFTGLPAPVLGRAAALLLLDTAASLATPLLVGVVTAHLLEEALPLDIDLRATLLAWALLVVLQAASRYLSVLQLGAAAAQVSARLRCQAYEHIQSLPMAFFHLREHGDLLSLLSEDSRRISQFLTQTATELAPHLITVVGAAAIMLALDPATGVAALCVAPLTLLAVRASNRSTSPLSRKLAERAAQHTALTEQNLRLISLIKAFTRENIESARYQQSSQGLLNAEMDHLRATSRINPLVHLLTGLALVVLAWVGSLRIDNGQLQAAELVSLIVYGLVMFRPLFALGGSIGAYLGAAGAAQRLQSLFATHPEPPGAGDREWQAPRQELAFRQVRFAYPGRPELFRSLDLTLPAGKTTAIAGPNGIGKSTLLNLLMRFHDPLAGEITCDGVSLENYRLASLRERMAYVPQRVQLVSGTIEDNIRYGLEDADPQAIARAASAALVDQFTKELPDGLATRVGPGGVRLSGGQRQRIALARALLRNTPVLLLDEPTAMFDPGSELQLLQRLIHTLSGKTVVIVTHRPQLLSLADHTITLGDNDPTGSQGKH